MAGIVIKGTGKATGECSVSNDRLAETVDTSDSWIRQKTGISSRYFAKEKNNRNMACEAAEKAVKNSGINKEDIELVIVATFTPDDKTPATACNVAEALGLSEKVTAFDLNGACAGFIYGCMTAEGFLQKEPDKYALVIGSEKISPNMDMNDRTTCVLFGDGAGAAILGYDQNAEFTFAGGGRHERDTLYCEGQGKINMAGQEVYRFAVEAVPVCIKNVACKAGLTYEDIDYFVCHQANERIIDHVARRTKADKNKFYKNLYNYGNTSAASIPIALSDMNDEGLLKNGTRLLCTGFGAGLTYGGMLIEYRGNKDEN